MKASSNFTKGAFFQKCAPYRVIRKNKFTRYNGKYYFPGISLKHFMQVSYLPQVINIMFNHPVQ